MAPANCWLAFASVLTVCLTGCLDTEAMRQSDPLVKEMDKLQAPAGAALLAPCRYTAKSASHRLYSCKYQSGSSSTELLKFYESQLQANGWR